MRVPTAGFTLIEALLSILIISLLAGLTMPLYQSFQSRTDLDVATEGVASMLRRAQSYARGMNYDSAWGVHIQSGSATLYKGTVYASRDTSYDETTTIPTPFTPSGLADVSFAKLSGAPSATGTVALAGLNNETRAVILNAEGMVAY